jgi:Na+-transporting NADH:ubiquinone oxidoreductase subunit NqrC
MNKLIASAFVSAVALFAAGAQAQEATFDDVNFMKVASQKTRAQVQAELVQARADGSIRAGEVDYVQPAKSVKTRAEVIAELRRAQANGEFAALNAEAVDPVAFQALVDRNAQATRLAGQPAKAQ